MKILIIELYIFRLVERGFVILKNSSNPIKLLFRYRIKTKIPRKVVWIEKKSHTIQYDK